MKLTTRLSILLLILTPVTARSQTLAELEVDEKSVQDSAFYSLMNHEPTYPNSTALHNVPPAGRAAVITQACEILKRFVASTDFEQRYQLFRTEQKPELPETVLSADELRKLHRTQLEKTLAEFEAARKDAPAEAAGPMQETAKELKDQLQKLDDPNNPMYTAETTAARLAGAADERQEHEKQVAEWEKEYPAKSADLLRDRVGEFLELTKDVDFTAQLTEADGIKTFSKPEYEAKPALWKLCYRCGKEATGAARTFAETWLKELAGK